VYLTKYFYNIKISLMEMAVVDKVNKKRDEQRVEVEEHYA
jgi:hypothetical protein